MKCCFSCVMQRLMMLFVMHLCTFLIKTRMSFANFTMVDAQPGTPSILPLKKLPFHYEVYTNFGCLFIYHWLYEVISCTVELISVDDKARFFPKSYEYLFVIFQYLNKRKDDQGKFFVEHWTTFGF